MAEFQPDLGFCGFYWHSTRIAKKGTDYIFSEGKQSFQKRAKENKVEWNDVREILFEMKKSVDQMYRNMLWHFRHSDCERCKYWDEMYATHLAKVKLLDSQELSDAEMMQAAMEIDGSK